MTDRTVAVRLLAITNQFQAGMAGAATSATGVKTAVAGMGTQVGAAGKQLTGMGAQAGMVNTKLLGAAGLAYGVKEVAGAAMTWESAFAGVTKTVDGTTAQLAALESGLQDMSTEIPTTAVELAGIAEAAGQLGVKTDDVLGFTRVMADLGETTNLTANEAAVELARFMNVMQSAPGDVDNLGSALVALGNNSETTEAEILTLSGRMAAAGRIAGLSEADVMGFAATLTSVGVEAEAGGTAMSKTFVKVRDAVLDGGDSLDTFARVAGMSATQFTQAFETDPARAIEAFISGLGRMNAAGQSTTSVFEDLELNDERLKRALLSTASAGDHLSDRLALANDAVAENSALTEEAAKRYETAESKMAMFGNTVDKLKVKIGQGLLPAIADTATGLTDLLNMELPDWMVRDPAGWDVSDVIAAGARNIPYAFGLGGLMRDSEPDVDPEVERSLQAQTDRYQAQADAAAEAAGANDNLAGSLDDVADAAGDAADETENYQEALEGAIAKAAALADPVFALFDAQNQYVEAQKAATEAIAEHGATSDEAVGANQDLVMALLTLQSAAINAGMDFDGFERQLDEWVAQGRITEQQADTLRHGIDDARKAAEEFRGDYHATLTADDQASATIDRLIDKLGRVQGTYAARLTLEAQAHTGGGGGPSGGSSGGGGNVPTNAMAAGGTFVAGQELWVGEEGPEKVRFGHPGQVFDARTSAAMGGGGDMYVTVEGSVITERQLLSRLDQVAAQRARRTGRG